MDVFKIDRSLSASLGSTPPPDKLNADVSFDAGSEFNLSFFDQPEDSASAGAFSDPGSVGSTSVSSPPPPSQLPSPAPLGIGPKPPAPEQQYAAADSNSSTPTKSFVPCKVCGDKASGYHYGVTSCEGCKGFFRRSIQKQIEYRCLRDGKCLVIRLNRNRCQYCRFKKCLQVGMSRDSVRYGRVPKRSRPQSEGEKEDARVSTTDSSDGVVGVGVGVGTVASSGLVDADSKSSTLLDIIDSKSSALLEIIVSVAAAHQTHCEYTDERTRGLLRKPIAASPPSPSAPSSPEVASSTAESLEQQRIWLWQHLANRVTPTVQRVVEFAKRVPGFCELSQDDQLILIKVGFFELWLTCVARLVSDSSLTFADGSFVTRQQMEIMYDSEFVSSVFHFAISLNALALNDAEVGLFSAVVLLSADRPGVTDIKAVEHFQDCLIEALKVQLGRNHPNDSQLTSSLLLKLAELRGLGAKHGLHLDWFRANWDRLRLPPLFAEIFDIPKCEEDLQ